jgi:plastocyanin
MRLSHGAASLAVALFSVNACGGGSGSTPAAPSASGGGGNPVTVTITRQAGTQSFSPNPASAGGQMVVFRNADSIVHRVRLNDGSFDTGDIAPGATSRALQMPPAGTNYHCPLHPDMVGAVSASSGAPPPACEGPYCGDGGINY